MAVTEQKISAWLKKRAALDVPLNLASAMLAFVIGSAIMFIVFWLVYYVLEANQGLVPRHSHATRVVISFVVVATLFVVNAIIDRGELETHFTPGVGMTTERSPLGTDVYKNVGKGLVTAVLAGPKCIANAARMILKAVRLFRMDRDQCAAVLALLLARGTCVPFAEIGNTFPYIDTGKTLLHLRDIDGVLFLHSADSGLGLSSKLVGKLETL